MKETKTRVKNDEILIRFDASSTPGPTCSLVPAQHDVSRPRVLWKADQQLAPSHCTR